MKKLNTRGASHIVALMLVIVTIGIGGSYMLIMSHADACTGTSDPVSGAASSPVSGCPTSSPVSNPTLPSLQVTAPTVSGTARLDSTLQSNGGGYPSGATATYQWYANGVAISGATQLTYKLQAAQVGKTITIALTAAKSGYASKTVQSAPTAVVAPGTLYITTTHISGSTTKDVGYTPYVGSTFAAYVVTSPTGATLKYQWYANNVAVSGAIASTFKPTAAQYNKSVTMAVTASKLGYATVTGKSTGSVVLAGTLKTATPTISGTAKVGKTLTANPGTWTPGTSFKYQWYYGGSAIKKATGKTFKITKTQKGHPVMVQVTGTQTGYKTATNYSKNTAKVK